MDTPAGALVFELERESAERAVFKAAVELSVGGMAWKGETYWWRLTWIA